MGSSATPAGGRLGVTVLAGTCRGMNRGRRLVVRAATRPAQRRSGAGAKEVGDGYYHDGAYGGGGQAVKKAIGMANDTEFGE